MPLYSIVKPIASLRDIPDRKHADLEEVEGDPILATGKQLGAGTLAQRPPAGNDGRYWYVDEAEPTVAERDKLYRDTGAVWQEIVSRATATATPPTGARVFRSTAQSMPNVTDAALIFDTETYDNGGYWDPAAPSRFTIPAGKAGKYLIIGHNFWKANATGHRSIIVFHNGLQRATTRLMATDFGTTAIPQQTVMVVDAAVDDFFEIMVDQTSGAALDTLSGTGFVWAAIHYLGT